LPGRAQAANFARKFPSPLRSGVRILTPSLGRSARKPREPASERPSAAVPQIRPRDTSHAHEESP
jgi:hypothetical protein